MSGPFSKSSAIWLDFGWSRYTKRLRVARLSIPAPSSRIPAPTATIRSSHRASATAEARVEFERSLEVQPDQQQTLFNMGVLLLEHLNVTEGAIE